MYGEKKSRISSYMLAIKNRTIFHAICSMLCHESLFYRAQHREIASNAVTHHGVDWRTTMSTKSTFSCHCELARVLSVFEWKIYAFHTRSFSRESVKNKFVRFINTKRLNCAMKPISLDNDSISTLKIASNNHIIILLVFLGL